MVKRIIRRVKRKAIVPDTSVLVNGQLSEIIKKGKVKNVDIIIPQLVLDELQSQASRNRETGFRGLEEIKKIRELAKEKGIKLTFAGRKPTLEEISLAKKGRIDALIKDIAVKKGASLITSDYVQALVAEAEGVDVYYIPFDISKKKIRIEEFFTKDTQSVHLKAGVKPFAKIGKPGNIKLVEIGDSELTENELKLMISEIMAKSYKDPSSFVEISKHGAMVIQMGEYRIAITRPPFSTALEITAVRPIVKLNLKDYNLHSDLEKRILESPSGILITGPPGSGKSTFAASIAEYLSSHGKIVKTFEQPRDLQVGPKITQYAPLEGDWSKTAELLLLVRPDYTIFDEIRRTTDFRVFADMRLAGVGMIGVVHATDPISAIQRFIGRVELGMIPHIVDTVIYIKDGKIEKTYKITLTVKVPTGMKEQDLARPVVEVREYESNKLEYEIYTYGEENIVVPIEEEKENPLIELAKKALKNEFKRWDRNAEIIIDSVNNVTVRVRNEVIPKIIGRGGKRIEEIEKAVGMKINIEPIERTIKKQISFEFEDTGRYINICLNKTLVNKKVDIYADNEFLFSAIVGKDGKVRVKKKSNVGRAVMQAFIKRKLKIFV
ncbi:MAG TPA: ATPase [Candidatus Aenigmarchaeota archaeon]|nr:MAG: ATPase [Candidatus Aenigmarchaeota archaeon]HDD46002.1 ATPase [Candidatus Aenigmarchaeota archaeon]